MTYKIMFSYSRKNSAERAAFVGHLRSIEGVTVLYDRQDIELGAEVHKNLSNILHEIDCLIVLLTNAGLASKEVLDEAIRAHERGKCIIPIVAEETSIYDLPWFIRELNFIKYDPAQIDAVLDDLKHAVEKRILVFKNSKPFREVKSEGDSSRAILPGVDVYSWDEWWARIVKVSGIVKTGVDNGHFSPSAILGISNGGLAVADLFKRLIFSGARPPVLSLWADRWSGGRYFDNEFNGSILRSIRKESRETVIELLIIDDAVRSCNTILQCIEFVHNILGETVKIVFVPLLCRHSSMLGPIEGYLPFSYEDGRAFMVSRDIFYSLIESPKSFPYKVF